MSRHIYVSSLTEMPRFVRALKPSHLISIIQPEFQPPRPAEIELFNHHRVGVHDISEPAPAQRLIDRNDVDAMIAFIDEWNPDRGSLLVHCFAGVSRSTATALIAHSIKSGSPERSARALRAAAPHAIPNRRVIELADDILSLHGALVAAREAMGAPTQAVTQASLTELSL